MRDLACVAAVVGLLFGVSWASRSSERMVAFYLVMLGVIIGSVLTLLSTIH